MSKGQPKEPISSLGLRYCRIRPVSLRLYGVTAFLLALCLFLGACRDDFALPGDRKNYDPIAALPDIINMIGGSHKLVAIEAEGVRPDGTIDVNDKVVNGTAKYVFFRTVNPPSNQPPLGAGGSTETVWHQQAIAIAGYRGWRFHEYTSSDGSGVTPRWNRGVAVDRWDPRPGPGRFTSELTAPSCSFKDVWASALKEGAPQNAVASIKYKEDIYRFEIPGTDLKLQLNSDCTPLQRR